MTLKLTAAAALLLAVAVFSSCKKKEGINENLDNANQAHYDFMSTDSASYWRYGSRGANIYTRYAMGFDSVKNGLTLSYFERLEDNAALRIPEYFGKNNDLYVTLIDFDGKKSSYANYVFWIDSAAQGKKWENTSDFTPADYPGFGKVNVYTESEQVETDINLSYAGQSFDHVVHVHTKLQANAPPIVPIKTSVGSIDLWFVKGLGVIREEANFSILGAFTNTHIDSLIDYHIVP